MSAADISVPDISRGDIVVKDSFEELGQSWQKVQKDLEEHAPPGMRRTFLKSFMAGDPYIWHILILASVAKKETYGYEIISAAEKLRLRGQPKLSASKVYPIFHELEACACIKGKWKERKKVYTITAKGKEMFKLVKKISKESMIAEKKMFNVLFDEDVKI